MTFLTSGTSERGLTILEMLVAIATSTLIMVAIANSILLFYRANTSSLEQAFQVESARKGVNLFVRDMREVTYADNGAYPILSMASTSITFYTDTDRDVSAERLKYVLVGSTLFKVITEATGAPATYTGGTATSTVSEYVWNISQGVPLFRYYTSLGTEITDYANVADVRSVTVNIIVNVNPLRAPGEFTLRSSATLRNFRSQ